MRFSYKEEYTQKKLIKWYLLQLKWEKQIVWNILEGEKSMGIIMLDYDYNIIIHLMKKNLIAETIYFLWILCILWSIKEKECYLFIRLQNDRIFISHPSNPISNAQLRYRWKLLFPINWLHTCPPRHTKWKTAALLSECKSTSTPSISHTDARTKILWTDRFSLFFQIDFTYTRRLPPPTNLNLHKFTFSHVHTIIHIIIIHNVLRKKWESESDVEKKYNKL